MFTNSLVGFYEQAVSKQKKLWETATSTSFSRLPFVDWMKKPTNTM